MCIHYLNIIENVLQPMGTRVKSKDCYGDLFPSSRNKAVLLKNKDILGLTLVL